MAGWGRSGALGIVAPVPLPLCLVHTRPALGCFPVGFEAVTIKHLEPMGGYAVHLAFSDEHARGIFPWAYLRDLATERSGYGATNGAQSG